MASIQYHVQEQTNVYLSFGSGFDTPTLNQVFYSPANVANPAVPNTGNIGLQAARTQQVEIGVKSELSSTTQANIAVFRANTSNDIVVQISNAGRTAFGNAPKTERQGLELNAQTLLPFQLQASVAYTWLSAKVAQTYLQFNGIAINDGNRIPGVPNQGLFVELMWRKADKLLEFAAEGRAAGSIAANDINAAYSSGYGIMNLRAVARQNIDRWTITEYARIDNVFDRAYVGSLIVNQAASQFYESAPGRNWLTGVKASYKF
jgi:iron complex outermembrane receptor protein